MCGIFGWVSYGVERSPLAVAELLLTGLRRLEYRGYDSAGLAVTAPEGDATAAPLVVKRAGKVDALADAVRAEPVLAAAPDRAAATRRAASGVAHTRWATHGAPEARNSHPHTSGGDSHDFVVVHNGIITNYQYLRKSLESHGFVFESDTDTEVVPKLCKYLHASSDEPIDFRTLVTNVCLQLEGAYALLFTSRLYPDELVAVKRGSPLIFGVKVAGADGDNGAAPCMAAPRPSSPTKERRRKDTGGFATPTEYCIASDASAVVEHTRQVMVMEDDDLVHLDGSGYELYKVDHSPGANANCAGRAATFQTLQMEVHQIMKGNFDHFMQKEIHEQPDSLLQTVRGRVVISAGSPPRLGVSPSLVAMHDMSDDVVSVAGGGPRSRIVLGGLRDHLQTIRRSRRLVFCACGTSYHACVATRPVMEELSDLPVQLELASDMLDRRCPIFRDDAVVFVSQSGETADTLMALEYAKGRGAFCIGITNTVGSAISRATHCGVHINAGAEIGVASTKAYTSQIAALVMVALALSEDSVSKAARREEIIADLARLPTAIRKVLELDAEMHALADSLKGSESLLVFGRGANFATALECALKVKEVALVHSEGLLAGEMKHGPLALVDDKIPLIVVATRDSTYVKMQNVIQQLRARAGRLIVLASEEDVELVSSLDDRCQVIRVPELSDCVQTIVNIVPLQLLSYHLTVLRGFDVDQPRNLAKSVTTE